MCVCLKKMPPPSLQRTDPLPQDLPSAFVQQPSANMEEMGLCGAHEDSQWKQTLALNAGNTLSPLSFLGVAPLNPELPPMCVPLTQSQIMAGERSTKEQFCVCAQLLHMTVDISLCCQNVINKTWGMERAPTSPFNHSSICNENFMQCVIFS